MVAGKPGTAEICDFLGRPESYPEKTVQVQRVETHISAVFLTDLHAYKLKKPVRFDFLDFSTVEFRRHACQEELRLNRRLAPDVYLDVVPVTCDQQGGLQLSAAGEPVDWLVKMRRLPDERTLERLIESDGLSDPQINALGRRLWDFYRGLEPESLTAEQYLREIRGHTAANREELLDAAHALPAVVVRRVHGAQLQFLSLEADVFAARVDQGRIVEGHGDLRPEHVYFDPQPVIIDCIEFNREFRTLDVADELCFLAMECQRLGHDQFGGRLLADYAETCGDRPDVRLLAFYQSYRACVRAKVAALRCAQLPPESRAAARREAADYLRLADHHAGSFARRLVVVVRGLMGTGKSTLAGEVARRLGAEHLQTDAVRRELLGPSPADNAYGQGRYRPDVRRRVYEELFQRGEQRLNEGRSVVLDGTFLTAELRQQAAQAAQAGSAELWVVACRCPDEIVRQRIARRRAGPALSEARPELLQSQKNSEEPPQSGEPSWLQIDTSGPIQQQVDAVIDRLSQRK